MLLLKEKLNASRRVAAASAAAAAPFTWRLARPTEEIAGIMMSLMMDKQVTRCPLYLPLNSFILFQPLSVSLTNSWLEKLAKEIFCLQFDWKGFLL